MGYHRAGSSPASATRQKRPVSPRNQAVSSRLSRGIPRDFAFIASRILVAIRGNLRPTRPSSGEVDGTRNGTKSPVSRHHCRHLEDAEYHSTSADHLIASPTIQRRTLCRQSVASPGPTACGSCRPYNAARSTGRATSKIIDLSILPLLIHAGVATASEPLLAVSVRWRTEVRYANRLSLNTVK